MQFLSSLAGLPENQTGKEHQKAGVSIGPEFIECIIAIAAFQRR
jgi:hypothetical protein